MTGGDGGCRDIEDLLGAYALDAVEPDEEVLVRSHVAECPRCSHELAEHRETISMVASAGGSAPDGVWARIAESIPQDPRTTPRPSVVVLGDRRKWRLPARIGAAAAAGVAAAALVLVGIQTVRVDQLNHRVNQLSAAARQSGGFQGLAAALLDPSARRMALTSTAPSATSVGDLVILPSGSAYLVGSTLPALAPGKTYQLWSIVGGRAVSVGLLGAHPRTAAFTVDPSVAARTYLVTIEPAGGVVAPTTAPVARAAT